jgi:hypothetical protein
MKYPLKRRHWIGRELVCFFWGHRWKLSPTRETKYFDMTADEVPYDVRKRSRNYMWETVAWWGAKCTRCRIKLRDSSAANVVWYRATWQAAKNATRDAAWWSKYVWDEEDYTISTLNKLWIVPVVFGLSWLSQFFMNFDTFPDFLWSLPFDIRDSFFGTYLRDRE